MRKDNLPKDKFFKRMERMGLALAFDDVRLRTGYSEVMPENVSVETKFSKNVSLKIPIVSAAMDTVTEYKLAIELAKLGGIGVIHRNLTPEEQAYQVARVKNHLNALTGLIEKPVCVYEEETIEEILRKKEKKDYPFDSFPVLNRNGILVGILAGNDFDFCDNKSLRAKDVMTKEVITTKEGTSLDDAYEILKGIKKKALPLVNDKREVVGLYTFRDLKDIKSGRALMYNIDERGQLRVAASIGTGKDAFNRLELLVEENVDVVVIDTAHGDSKNVIDALKEIKKDKGYNKVDIVAGNISEAESAKRLLDAGADGIKIGQGPGAICTTRVIAGIGCPQVTAIYNCSKVADKYGIPVCADGGLRYSGDITIAIGAGAHSVMLGSMLAGTEEAPGDLVFSEGRQCKSYRGMGSLEAMKESKGSRERYCQEEKNGLIPEGIEGLVPCKGKLELVVNQYIGGLRSGMGYLGTPTIEKLREEADFVLISVAGKTESHPHDVKITKEAPNYPGQ